MLTIHRKGICLCLVNHEGTSFEPKACCLAERVRLGDEMATSDIGRSSEGTHGRMHFCVRDLRAGMRVQVSLLSSRVLVKNNMLTKTIYIIC